MTFCSSSRRAAGLRFTYAPGLGRTGLEDLLEENVPAYEAPDSDNLFMASFYLGASLFQRSGGSG